MSDFAVAVAMSEGSTRDRGEAGARGPMNIGDGLRVFPNDALQSLQHSREPGAEEIILRETPELFQGA